MLYELNPYGSEPRLLRTTSWERPAKVSLAPFDLRKQSDYVIRHNSAPVDGYFCVSSSVVDTQFAKAIEDACRQTWMKKREENLENASTSQNYAQQSDSEAAALSGKLSMSQNGIPAVSKSSADQDKLQPEGQDRLNNQHDPTHTESASESDYTPLCSATVDTKATASVGQDDEQKWIESMAERVKLEAAKRKAKEENSNRGMYYYSQPVSSLSMGGIDFASLVYSDSTEAADAYFEPTNSLKFESSTLTQISEEPSKSVGYISVHRWRSVWKGWARKKNGNGGGNVETIIVSEQSSEIRQMDFSAKLKSQFSQDDSGCFSMVNKTWHSRKGKVSSEAVPNDNGSRHIKPTTGKWKVPFWGKKKN